MIVNCLSLSYSEQIDMMNKLRQWKSTDDGRMTVSFGASSYYVIGRGMTPKTYDDLVVIRNKANTDMYKSFHDFAIKNSSGEIIGVIGYQRHEFEGNTPVPISGLYFAKFDNANDFTIIKALDEVYDLMIKTSDTVDVIAINGKNNSTFKRNVLDKYRILLVEERKHLDSDFVEHDALRVIIKGSLNEKGA